MPSDADAQVARLQEDYDLFDVEWPRVDARGSIDEVLGAVRPLGGSPKLAAAETPDGRQRPPGPRATASQSLLRHDHHKHRHADTEQARRPAFQRDRDNGGKDHPAGQRLQARRTRGVSGTRPRIQEAHRLGAMHRHHHHGADGNPAPSVIQAAKLSAMPVHQAFAAFVAVLSGLNSAAAVKAAASPPASTNQ
jgi:hypothetical protein